MNDETESYMGVLTTKGGYRVRGVADFTDAGMIITGAPVPYEHEVVGLPSHTRFVPYTNIDCFVFDASDDKPDVREADLDKLFGGSE